MMNCTKFERRKYRKKSFSLGTLETDEIRLSTKSSADNCLNAALRTLENSTQQQVLLTSSGNAIGIAITLCEMIKRTVQPLHQLTEIGTVVITDEYTPLEEELDTVTNNRNVSFIRIILSKNASVESEDAGYQPPCPELLNENDNCDESAVSTVAVMPFHYKKNNDQRAVTQRLMPDYNHYYYGDRRFYHKASDVHPQRPSHLSHQQQVFHRSNNNYYHPNWISPNSEDARQYYRRPLPIEYNFMNRHHIQTPFQMQQRHQPLNNIKDRQTDERKTVMNGHHPHSRGRAVLPQQQMMTPMSQKSGYLRANDFKLETPSDDAKSNGEKLTLQQQRYASSRQSIESAAWWRTNGMSRDPSWPHYPAFWISPYAQNDSYHTLSIWTPLTPN